jgi:hypothetical protein
MVETNEDGTGFFLRRPIGQAAGAVTALASASF